MVIVRLEGGLGNQLFQYAVGRRVAHKLNTELKLDLSSAKISYKPKNHANYRLGDFNIQENFATPEEIAHVRETGTFSPPFPNFEEFQGDIFIQGHSFHSEEAFNEIDDIIRKEFTLKNPLHEIAAAWEKKILAAECSVAVHIRHGDYLNSNSVHITGIISLSYYKTCLEELKKSFPNITAFIFAQDMDWAKENLNFDVPTEFVADVETDNEEFYLMSLCKHTIIANSTFSWWAAYLNPNPDKKIFAPTPWTRSGMWDNGISETWTKIPANFDDMPVECPPFLSIIVYVKNNAQNLPFLFSNIFTQTYKDFELILIDDTSTDGSKNICLQASLYKNVSLIAPGKEIGKAKAFNRGLDCARGEYVMFLSGNDFILQNAIQSLIQTYSFRQSNLVFSVQYLEENPEGNIFVTGLEKNFSQRIDEQFKDLNIPMISQNDDFYQKLLMTGSQVFNPLLATKFFKREFLTENALRFNENIGNDVEIPFIANAVMFSDEISFIPDMFYVIQKKS